MRTPFLRGGIVLLAAVLNDLLMLIVLPAAPPAPAAEPAPPVRIGMVRSMFKDAPDPLIQLSTNVFKSLMEEQTGLASNVTVASDAAQLARQLKEGKLQLGAFHGFEFAWSRQQNPDLKPLMIAVKQQSFVRALLVVRQDNKAADAAALQGKTLALALLTRQHCRLFLDRRCVRPGMPMDKWFGKVSSPRTDQDALDDVAEGHADAAVVDDVELESFRTTYPKTAAKLRVLKQSEVFPCTVIAYQPGALNEETLKQLRVGLIAAKTVERGRKLLDVFHMTGFEEVPDDYEKSVAEILKAYPPPGK